MPGRPSAARIFDNARVVDRRLRGIEFGVLPDRAQGTRALSPRRAGIEVDVCAVVRITCHVDHLLVKIAVIANPTLHNLNTLQRGPRPVLGPRILQG